MKLEDVKDPGIQRALRSIAAFTRMGADRTAEFLEKWGMKGTPERANACTLAEYFRTVSGHDRVHVSGHIQIGNFSMPCPPVLKQVWTGFDSGKYRNLWGATDRSKIEALKAEKRAEAQREQNALEEVTVNR